MSFKNEIEHIYNLYVDDLFAYALHLGFERSIVMDGIHDVFINLYYDGNVKVKNIRNLKFYLFRALRNTLINFSKRKSNSNLELKYVEDTYDETHSADNLLLTQEQELLIKNRIDNLLKSLTNRQHEIVYLRYVEEYSYDEIAEIMKITPGACRKLMHKAMKSLRVDKNTTKK